MLWYLLVGKIRVGLILGKVIVWLPDIGNLLFNRCSLFGRLR